MPLILEVIYLKYGIVGTGWIAKAFKDGSDVVDGFDAYCVYSRKEETGKAFAEENNLQKVYTDINIMAESSEIEAVYIASPNCLHYEQSKLFLEKGKHVICEKPITVTPDEFEELCLLAESKNLIYMEALMMMHFPNTSLLEETLNKIGNIKTAHIDFSQLSSKYPALKRGENPNIFNPKMATGCLMDLGIYNVSLAIRLFGYPEKITATAGFLEAGADGWGTAVFHYADKDVTLTYSKVGQSRGVSQFMGDEGTVTVESISKIINIDLYDNNGERSIVAGDTEKEEVMSYEAKDFYNMTVNLKENEQLYKRCKEISLLTSKAMYEIRNICGIKFE